MKLAPDCYECLHRLIRQATALATDDAALRQTAIRAATRILDDDFSYDQLSIVIATRIHGVIRDTPESRPLHGNEGEGDEAGQRTVS